MQKSYWALGAADARLGLTADVERHRPSSYEENQFTTPYYSYSNGFEFAREQMAKENVTKRNSKAVPVRKRFAVQTANDPEGMLPGTYYFVIDRNTSRKVSRYGRSYDNALKKAERYEAKAKGAPMGDWPEVGRPRELIDSKYVVPTPLELMALQVVNLFATLGLGDLDKVPKQLRRFEEREARELAEQEKAEYLERTRPQRERALGKSMAFAAAYGADPKKLTPFSKALEPREFRSDYGDVRPESTGDVYPWIVVGIENPGELKGTFWYVQNPSGSRVTGLTTDYQVAHLWAAGRKAVKAFDESGMGPLHRERGYTEVDVFRSVTPEAVRAYYQRRYGVKL